AAAALSACAGETGTPASGEDVGQAIDALTTAIHVFQSVGVLGGGTATLRGSPGSTDIQLAVLAGDYAPGDGGGGVFYWSTTGTHDGGIVFGASTSDAGSPAGYWVRIYSGPIDVRWFGAKGDGTTLDTTAVNDAITAAKAKSASSSNGATVYFS